MTLSQALHSLSELHHIRNVVSSGLHPCPATHGTLQIPLGHSAVVTQGDHVQTHQHHHCPHQQADAHRTYRQKWELWC